MPIGDVMKRIIVIECVSAWDDRELVCNVKDTLSPMIQIESVTVAKPLYQLRYVPEDDKPECPPVSCQDWEAPTEKEYRALRDVLESDREEDGVDG